MRASLPPLSLPSPQVPVGALVLAVALSATLPLPGQSFRRGDTNGDGGVDVSDAVSVLGYLFLGDSAPTCLDAADADDSGKLDLTDAVVTFGFLFLGSRDIPAPGARSCGADPTDDDDLDCESYGECPVGDAVEDTLGALGIDTGPTPRLSESGEPLPDDYDPLGAKFTSGLTRELFLMGIHPELSRHNRGGVTSMRVVPDGPGRWWSQMVYDPGSSGFDWAREPGAATAADTDGNGLNEIVTAHIENRRLILRLLDQTTIDGGAVLRADLRDARFVEDTAITAGDLDGDGDDEIVVLLGMFEPTLVIADRSEEGFSVSRTHALPAFGSRAPIHGQVDAGNIDEDPADEILVVTSEDPTDGQHARAFVLDDLSGGLRQLVFREFESDGFGEFAGSVGGGALGDIDGDGLDEVVLAWVASWQEPGGGFGIPGASQFERRLVAIDDATRDFRTIGQGGGQELGNADCQLCTAEASLYLPVHTPDLDGNGAAEVVVGTYVYGDWKSGSWREIDRIGWSLSVNDFGDLGYIDRDTAAFDVGDVTGDGKDNIVVYRSTDDVGRGEVAFFAHDGRDGIRQMIADFSRGSRNDVIEVRWTLERPVVLAANLDGASLQYTGESRQVYTQPLINAVLAAPPCGRDGQVDAACRTSFGLSDFWSGSREETFTVSAGVHVGASFEASVFGVEVASAEMKAKVTTTATELSGSSYTLTKSVQYTTGPNEDAVILTTVPYD